MIMIPEMGMTSSILFNLLQLYRAHIREIEQFLKETRLYGHVIEATASLCTNTILYQLDHLHFSFLNSGSACKDSR